MPRSTHHGEAFRLRQLLGTTFSFAPAVILFLAGLKSRVRFRPARQRRQRFLRLPAVHLRVGHKFMRSLFPTFPIRPRAPSAKSNPPVGMFALGLQPPHKNPGRGNPTAKTHPTPNC